MAHDAFKTFPIDVHTGGIDLKFPHHENELAQSEAYYNKKQWINYFFHYGHLHIDGKKMARRIKNFTTIKEQLAEINGRQIRLYFLMHAYDSVLNYDPDTAWDEIKVKDKFLNEWFISMQAATRKG